MVTFNRNFKTSPISKTNNFLEAHFFSLKLYNQNYQWWLEGHDSHQPVAWISINDKQN